MRKRSRNGRKMRKKKKAEILASAAAGEKGKKKKREKFLGSAARIKGRKEGGFNIIFLAFSSGWRKKTAPVAGFFHGFSGCSCSWTPQLVIGSILFRILSILFKLGVLFLLALILLYG